MRALVTGSAGFVGQRLLPRLRAAGFEVVATDREVDVRDGAAVEATVRAAAPGLVVHLAAQSSVVASWRDPETAYRVNYLGTRNVLAAVAGAAPQARLLIAGSGQEYGSGRPDDPPFSENSPLRPASPYATTKAAADLLAAAYAERGLEVVRTRSFNHTGVGQSEDFALPSFARQAVEIALGLREPRLRVGNLDSVRDFLDVEDVVAAYLALSDPPVPVGCYNVASGTGVRIGDALERILACAGIDPEVEVDPERLRPGDCAVGDASRLRSATGWEPRIPLNRTLEALVEHWRRVLAAA